MTRTALVLAAFVSLALLGQAGAAESPKIVQPDAFTWQPAQGLPPGAEMTVLYGDPSKAEPFALRFKFPAGYEIATHSHSNAEFITVLSGKGRMTFGEKADPATAEPLPAGAFMNLPAGAWHHLWIDEATIVELHSTGPFDVHMATQ